VDSDNYFIGRDGRAIIYPNNYFIDYGYETVKVIYTAGFITARASDKPRASVPADLKKICVQEVVRAFNNRKEVGIINKTMDDGSVVKIDTDLLDNTKMVLDRYKKVYIV
jgi:hypothetical protein